MTLNPGDASIAAAAQSAQNFQGMNPALQKQVMALVNASHGKVYIKSGYRSPQEQQSLYDNAAQQGGDEYASRMVADPQASNHVQGLAVDLGGDLQVMNQLAPQFGLHAPMPWEPWHFEFPSTTESAHPAAYTVPPSGEQNPTQAVQAANKPQSMAAKLAESLLALHQNDQNGTQGVLPTGQDALAQVEETAPAPKPQPAQGVQAPPATGGSGGSGGVPAYTPGGGAFGGVPQQQWANDFLTKAGLPVTPENLRFMTAWEQAESGGGGGHFNPLNTTEVEPGDTSYNYNNGDPVKNYTSYEEGLQANVTAFQNGRYGNIISALQQGDNAMSAAQALAASPWGTGSLVTKILGGG